MEAPKVLVLDHKLLDVMTVKKSLQEHGYQITYLTSPNGVLAKLDFERPDALLVNPWMPRLDIDNLLATVLNTPVFEEMVVVVLSDRDATELQNFCLEYDLHGYYSKSRDLEKIGAFLDHFFA